ncbi:Rhamnolipids biosynthesis 3-oxoacyl-[acyl-carrier-protein] reductase [Grifola frondosa]|uniref:Rhamnolipids biosynthesis 3-oxoacyl-[acyl-carrier-protein] reductase n=1 Tax=Grifola frondosa TaxID=5627 RepID=A0A1C7MC24_GRIFR|nr:Rhamnolipids biosynthesis 3-oxoacyl-[acyl-carrier-protein] reductase [Grifola frondosa]
MAEAVLDRLTASNLFDLRGVVAVVTGGGTGIGLMMSTTLVANGATVYIIGPKQEDLDRVANVYNDTAQKTNRPGRMYGIQGDIRRKSEALRLAEEVGKREKHITVLFNNAGVLSGSFQRPAAGATPEQFRAAFFDAVPEEAFDNNMQTNAIGPYWLTFAFLPLLAKWKESPGGSRFAPQIVNTSSMNGWTKDPATSGFSFPYMFSKSAIGHATSTLAHELLPLGIRVNGIAPGFFVSEMTAPGTADITGQSHLPPGRHIAFEIPASQPPPAPGAQHQRGGTNKDMGTLVLFLVANWFVDGETVLIDGGTLLRHPSSY